MSYRVILEILNYILSLFFTASLAVFFSIEVSWEITTAETFDVRHLIYSSFDAHYLNKTRNLSNNIDDSVYSQVASSGNNVYVVWEQSVKGQNAKNYDIFFMVSNNGGINFSDPVNLSNNKGFSEHPQISATENNVYILWIDNSNGTRQILFRKSVDGGENFDQMIKLSKNISSSYNAELAAFGSSLIAVWNELDMQKGNVIMLKESEDRGFSFEETKELGASDLQTYPKIVAYKDQTYVTWNTNRTNDQTHQIVLSKVLDDGHDLPTMQKRIAKYLQDGESHVTALDRNVLVFWTDGNAQGHKNLYYTRSTNYGNDFGDIVDISQRFDDSSNVETAFVDGNLYVVWQEGVSGNQEIFMRTSSNGGVTFGQAINISNNKGTSECPSISVSNNKVHVVWEDDTLGNHEIYYKSIHGNITVSPVP